MATRIALAEATDFAGIRTLLEESALPLAGLEDHLATTLVARQDGRIVGTAALEFYADGALLRSVAVDSAKRGHNLGHRLTDAAVQLARERRAPAVYLLTTTAEHFFPKCGFGAIERSDVPASVQESVEFESVCPATAVAMWKPLKS